MLISVSVIFADSHRGRNVYSIYTETFNGIGINNPEADEDCANFWPDGYPGAIFSTNYEDKIEGNQSCEMGEHTWLTIPFVNSKSTTTVVAHSMSDYENGKICFSLKFPTACDTNKAYIKIEDSNGAKGFSFSNEAIKRTDNSGTGVKKDDNNWYSYYIYLSSFTASPVNLDLANIKIPFIISADSRLGGTFLIDKVYYLKGNTTSADFSIKVKNVDGNTETDKSKPITFSSDKFRTGWAVANQYLEMDIDGEMEKNNWTIRVYTNDNSKKGIYSGDSVLDMAWRLTAVALPYEYKDYIKKGETVIEIQSKNTLEIEENWSDNGKDLYGLYDKGKVDFLNDKYPNEDYGEGAKWTYPWFFMQTKGDTSEDSSVWNNEGYHCNVNTDDKGKTNQNYESLANYYERKPKLYLALNTKEAYSLKYTGQIVISLDYE